MTQLISQGCVKILFRTSLSRLTLSSESPAKLFVWEIHELVQRNNRGSTREQHKPGAQSTGRPPCRSNLHFFQSDIFLCCRQLELEREVGGDGRSELRGAGRRGASIFLSAVEEFENGLFLHMTLLYGKAAEPTESGNTPLLAVLPKYALPLHISYVFFGTHRSAGVCVDCT